MVHAGDRIAQAIFIEKLNVKFEKVIEKDLFGSTKRGNCGFGSTGITVINKIKL